MRGMADFVLDAQGVRKQYFRKGRDSARYFDAVPPTSVELASGELLEVVGRSGSGKTTLLSMLAGLLEPSEGTVLLDGQDLYALDDATRSKLRNERFGVVPQGHTPLFDLTVLQNVCLPYTMYNDSGDVESRALDLLATFGIEELSECNPSELSGGELRRMAVARALICEPDIVFADEPTGDLDDQSTEVVLQALRKVADDGAAVFLVTHEQAAHAYADRTMNMGA